MSIQSNARQREDNILSFVVILNGGVLLLPCYMYVQYGMYVIIEALPF